MKMMNGMYGIHHSTILRSSYNQKAQNQYLNYLTDPRFQGKKIFSALLFEDNKKHKTYRILSSNCGNNMLQCYD